MLASPLLHRAPAWWLAAASALVLTVCVCVLSIAIRQPWLGLALAETRDEAGSLRVLRSAGPGADIASGTRLIEISDGADARLRLATGDLTPEPDTRYVEISAYRAFLARQQRLHALLRARQVTVHDDLGRHYVIQPAGERPLRDLPAGFWLQLLVAATGLLIGVGVWAFRRDDLAARYLAITGLGLMISAASAAIYSTRELALPASLFRSLQSLNGTGSLLFCAAFIATLWHYPTRLGRHDPGPWLIALYLLVAAAASLHWIPSFDLGLRLPILVGFVSTIALAVMQWRRTRGRPLERAALRWFLLAWFSGSSLFLGVIFVPALFGADTGAMQAYAFALFLLIYIGLAFGIARYRLFQLDRWWLNAWSVLLSGALLLLAAALMIYTLDVTPAFAMTFALALVGWLYFPIRQRVIERSTGPSGLSALPQLLRQVLATDTAPPQTLWRETLARLYRPLDIRHGERNLPQPLVLDNGLVLDVPGLEDDRSLRLTGCEGGRRLFGERDIEMARTVHAVTERLLSYRRAVDIGVERERSRVARDLHDDVGARLLELLHSTEGPAQHSVREVLDELRLVIHSLGSNGETLDDLLGICRAELGERTEASGVELHWSQADTLPALHLDPRQALHVVRVLREAAINALRHARPTRLSVVVDYRDAALELRVENDGIAAGAAARTPGRGLNTLSGRAQTLGGHLMVDQSRGGFWQVRLRLPLKPLASNEP